MANNTGGPAFPRPIGNTGHNEPSWSNEQDGMSLRAYFAGQALCGWIQSGAIAAISMQHQGQIWEPPMAFPVLAEACCAVADAMLAALKAK